MRRRTKARPRCERGIRGLARPGRPIPPPPPGTPARQAHWRLAATDVGWRAPTAPCRPQILLHRCGGRMASQAAGFQSPNLMGAQASRSPRAEGGRGARTGSSYVRGSAVRPARVPVRAGREGAPRAGRRGDRPAGMPACCAHLSSLSAGAALRHPQSVFCQQLAGVVCVLTRLDVNPPPPRAACQRQSSEVTLAYYKTLEVRKANASPSARRGALVPCASTAGKQRAQHLKSRSTPEGREIL